MARARNIKPAFFQNDILGELAPLDRLAFIGMWTIANFKGCIEYRPKMLKVQLLPYDECDIDVIVNNLEEARFIRFYSVQGKRYLKIINFEKHQNPHKNEREAGSDIPDITENDNSLNELKQDGTKPDLIGTTRADSLLLIPSTLIPDSSNTPPPKKSDLKVLVDLGATEQSAKDWLKIRKAKLAPLTKTALKELHIEALKAGLTDGQAIEICARKNWQNFNSTWNWKNDPNHGKAQSVQQARLNVANQIMGGTNGTKRQIIDINERPAIEGNGESVPKAAISFRKPDAG